jgi:Fibronectin type III domain
MFGIVCAVAGAVVIGLVVAPFAGAAATPTSSASASSTAPIAKPAKPAEPTATASDSSVRVTWTATPTATSYRVTLRRSGTAAVTKTLGGTKRSETFTGLKAKTHYSVTVQAANVVGRSPVSPARAITTKPVRYGYDVSWPQCGRVATLPKKPVFAIVGVNDGVEGTRNPCLTQELAWAHTAKGGTTMPKVSFYVEAADPHTETADEPLRWPTSTTVHGVHVAVPATYGTHCSGSRTAACAYVYGWATGYRDAHLSGITHPSKYTWWLDVEDTGVWGTSKQANRAILEGMAAYFTDSTAKHGIHAKLGIYSTTAIWKRIVGTTRTASPLRGALNWEPGGAIGGGSRSLAITRQHADKPFTPGSTVAVSQWTADDIDKNYAPSR